MGRITLQFFGRFQVSRDGKAIPGFRTQKVPALLAILGAEPYRPHRRETLMALLWPRMPDQSARANLRQILFLLRQAVPDTEVNGSTIQLFIANRETIQLNPEASVESDANKFEALLAESQAHEHIDLFTCLACARTLSLAVDLYQGDFLADFYLDDSSEFEEWAETTRQGYQRKALDALEILATINARHKAYAEARKFAERQLEIDNLRESAYRQLMESLALGGQRAEALNLYEICRRLLLEELAMSPSTRTTELYEKIQAGDLIFDSPGTPGVRGYEIKEKIGEGASGVLHRAIQPAIGREVAVKVIHRRYANDPGFIRRFESEAQTIARLEHPHIVPLYDYWRESDAAYLVMRLLRGGSLLAALEKGPWQPEKAQALLDQIAPALHTAHRQGIVHMDIKPGNLLFDEEGNAYLSDFGIAKDFKGDRALVTERELLKTLDYISPEQLQEGPITPQTDIYSLGAVLYETLTGEKPFPDVPLITLIQMHLQAPIPPVSSARPGLPAKIDEVIQRATAKRPSDRFSDVLEMADSFRQAIGGVVERTITHRPAVLDIDLPNPYKGLRPYQEVDADDFYGREALVNQLVKRLEGTRFLAVVGPSGSGKTSVVKAGLLPALRQGALPSSEDWFFAVMVPGNHPLVELEKALLPIAIDPPKSLVDPMENDSRGLLRTIRRILPGGGSSRLCLVIDQFEELFTQVGDEAERNHFLDSLHAALAAPNGPLTVVVTLRADFFDRPLQYQPLADLFKQHTELVLPLTHDELVWAIQEPAHQAGVRFEDGLVAFIVAEVSEQPGALPLMQYALTELFTARQNGLITRQAYAETGGVLGALARRADELYESLSASGQAFTRQAFLRLVTIGEGVEDTRRRLRLPELIQIAGETHGKDGREKLASILEQFAAARLLTFDRDPVTREPTVEVAHEALLRKWDRLRHWLNENRDDIRFERQLETLAREWEEAGWDDSFLLRGSRLDQYERWRLDSSLSLTSLEDNYLAASLDARIKQEVREAERRDRELETAKQLAAAERERARDQEQAANRLRRRAWTLAGAMVIAGVLGIIAFFAGHQALQNEAIARRSAAESQSLALASAALAAQADNNIDLALALALAANRMEQPPVFSQRSLYEVGFGPGTIRQIVGGGGWRWAMDVFPERSLVASGADDAIVILWDYQTGEELRRFEGGHTDSIGAVAFSPDGRLLLSGAYDDWLVLWDVDTGEAVTRRFNPAGDVNGLDISSDGSLAAAGTEFGIATLWDLQTLEQVGELVHNPEEQILPVRFSPDGHLLATGSGDGSVIVWDLASRAPLFEAQVFPDTVFDLDFSPDGKILAVGGISDAVSLLNVETGLKIADLKGNPDWTLGLAFSPDGAQLAGAVRDGAVMVWRVADGQVLQTFYGKEGRSLNVKYADDLTIVSSASSGNIRIWSLADERLRGSIAVNETMYSLADIGDERRIALGLVGQILIMDTINVESVLSIVIDGGEVTALGMDPGQKWLLSAVQDGAALNPEIDLILWELDTGEEIRRFPGHTKRIHSLAFSPDGTTFLSASDDREVILWDTLTGEVKFRFTSPTDTANAVAFSPDGTRFAAGFGTFRFVAIGEYLDNTIRMWNTETFEEMATYEGHEDAVVSMAFSPDGRYLLSGSIDTSVRLWDAETGQSVRRFEGHTSGVMSVGISPDGRYGVSGEQEGSIIIWDLETGDLLRRLIGHEGVVHFVSFTQEVGWIESASEDGSWRVWDPQLSLAGLESWITQKRYVPELPCAQQLLYGLSETCGGQG